MSREDQKKQAAIKALDYIKADMIVGVGTGSTVNYFIEALASIKGRLEAVVSSSKATSERLLAIGIQPVDLNSVSHIDIYVDGADEINPYMQCIKGGGGALTGEKIVVSVAKQFICIADENKRVNLLGKFPVAVEVIPMARSAVAREIVRIGGDPVYRAGFVSDYGNQILDVYNLELVDPLAMEKELNSIPGVVCNGIFARDGVDVLLLGTAKGVVVFT